MRQPRPKIVSILKRSLGCALLALGLNAAAFAGVARAAEIESFRITDDLYAIAVAGDIEPGDDAKFRAESAKRKHAIVILESDGGALAPALEIGKIIRLLDLSTLVMDDSTCVSSCALIWIAGSTRFLAPKARLGFHASYRDNQGQLEQTGVGNALIGRYLTLMNLPPKAVIFATAASPTEFLWLTAANKAEAGIDFEEFILGEDKTDENSPPAEKKQETAVLSSPPIVRSPNLPPPIIVTGGKQDATAETMTLEDIFKLMKDLMRQPGFSDQAFASAKIPTELAPIFKPHLESLYSDDRLIMHISKEMFASRNLLSRSSSAGELGRQIGHASVMQLTFSGFSRLSNEDVRQFFRFMVGVTTRLDDKQCKRAFDEDASDAFLEAVAISRMGEHELESYLSLNRRAIFAELSQYPSVVDITASEAKLGEESFAAGLATNISKLPADDQERMRRTLTNIQAANDKDACDGYYLIFKTLHDLEGMPGNWFRRYHIKSIAQK